MSNLRDILQTYVNNGSVPGAVGLIARGDRVESRHRGSIAVVDASGKLLTSFGDPDEFAFIRSTAKPFQLNPDPAFFYGSRGHKRAFAYLQYGVHQGEGFIIITGEVGAGKTVAARAAITGLDQTRHTLIYLPDPTTGTRGIHHHVVTALGGRPAHGSAELAAQAASLIAAEHGERGRLPLLVIDEAHLLTHAQLEELLEARGRELLRQLLRLMHRFF